MIADLVPSAAAAAAASPLAARVPVATRVATPDDLPFVDALQKRNGRAVGFFPRQQLAAYVGRGDVLVAEEEGRDEGGGLRDERPPSSLSPSPSSLLPLGYCIARDRYGGRDDVGCFYQVNVAPHARRQLVGAALVAATLARAAYGCRLFCCWCAQDLDAANRFWESLGFVPLAFRTGSRGKRRAHVFWQRRVRAGDDATPYWFPSQTRGGAIREDRLVLPIPPGTRWSDPVPSLLPPGEVGATREGEAPAEPRAPQVPARPAGPRPQGSAGASPSRGPPPALPTPPAVARVAVLVGGRLKYVDRANPNARPSPAPAIVPVAPAEPTPSKPKTKPKKHDPAHVAAARELRDRYCEALADGRWTPTPRGKHEVGRLVDARPMVDVVPALPSHLDVASRPALPAPIAA